MLWNTARLDTLVTVVDANEFPAMMNSLDQFKEKFLSETVENEEEGEKHISQLLLEQVEFANVVVLKMQLQGLVATGHFPLVLRLSQPPLKIGSPIAIIRVSNPRKFEVEVKVATDGSARAVNIINSDGPIAVKRWVKALAKEAQYRPALNDLGQPVPGTYRFTQAFDETNEARPPLAASWNRAKLSRTCSMHRG